jgi:hypothetical protein
MGLNFAESLIFICMSKENRHTILYAEDDLDDLFIVQQAFESYNETITIVHANNGFMALEYLKDYN